MGNKFMPKDRVKFYSKSDLSYCSMLLKALAVLKNYDKDGSNYSINDILELYNIQKFIEAKNFCSDFTDTDKAYFSDYMKKDISRTIGIFCSKFNDSTIVSFTKDIDIGYWEDYWDVFQKYKIYNRIAENTFKKLLEIGNFPMHFVLLQESLVRKYDNVLTDHLLSDLRSVDLLISKYFGAGIKEKINVPSGLTVEKKEQIVLNYIDSINANINTLETIFSMPVNHDFIISDETRAKAKEKHGLLVKDFFSKSKGPTLKTEIFVGFSESQGEDFVRNLNSKKYEIIVSDHWLENNLDYPTLLNNFIHVFDLVDYECRITNITKSSRLGVFERIYSMNDFNNYYQTGYEFEILNKFAIIQVAAYCEHLNNKYHIRMEDILQWFFDTYLFEEFDIKEFFVNMPSAGSTYLEKCRTLCCEIESVLKQYNVLSKHGFVNHNVIEVSSTPTVIQNVGSFIKNKYFYPNYDKCNAIFHLLFSDQTMLNYLENRKEKERYSCLFDLMVNDRVNISEYQDYQKRDIDYLIKKDIVYLDNDGFLKFANLLDAAIMYDLYNNEFGVSAFYSKKVYNNSLKRLIEKKCIYYTSDFLSIQESAYLNYYLNKAKYSNGKDLRNQYLHGTQKKRGNDDELHKINYYSLIMIFVILVIKINDELCLRDNIKNG